MGEGLILMDILTKDLKFKDPQLIQTIEPHIDWAYKQFKPLIKDLIIQLYRPTITIVCYDGLSMSTVTSTKLLSTMPSFEP